MKNTDADTNDGNQDFTPVLAPKLRIAKTLRQVERAEEEVEALVKDKHLKQVGFTLSLNPRRWTRGFEGSTEGDDISVTRLTPEEKDLNTRFERTTTKTAENLLDRLTRIRQSKAELLRAQAAIEENTRILEGLRTAGIPKLTEEFTALLSKFHQAREAETDMRESRTKARLSELRQLGTANTTTAHAGEGIMAKTGKRAAKAETTTKATETKKKAPQASVKDLLKALATATFSAEKRGIRAKLRSLGHKGGLGKKAPAKA